MQLATIGCGHAGGKIVDAILERQHSSQLGFVNPPLAVNTSRADLRGLDHVAERNRVLVGEDSVNGKGVGADNELGAELVDRNVTKVRDTLNSMISGNCDGMLVIAGLGGGAGSGGAPAIAAMLAEQRPEPVYGVGIIPHRSEGGMYMLNAARSLRTLRRETDAVIVFDNDTWHQNVDSGPHAYDQLNGKLADQLIGLFAGPHTAPDPLPAMTSDRIHESLDDADTVSIGIASEPVSHSSTNGILDQLRELVGTTTVSTPAVSDLVERAVDEQLSLPCKLTDADQGLIVIRGPPDIINRDGVTAGRQWLEGKTKTDVNAGVCSVPEAEQVTVTVALTGLATVTRLQTLRRAAAEAQASIGELKQAGSNKDSSIDPLF